MNHRSLHPFPFRCISSPPSNCFVVFIHVLNCTRYVPVHPVVPSVVSVPLSCACVCSNHHVGFLSGSALSLICILYLLYCQSVYLWLVAPNTPLSNLYLMTTVSRLHCRQTTCKYSLPPNTHTCLTPACSHVPCLSSPIHIMPMHLSLNTHQYWSPHSQTTR
jgi:hypothetical protein